MRFKSIYNQVLPVITINRRLEVKIEKVKSRGVLFTFEELKVEPYYCTTNVYVVIGSNDYYICDTYLGPFYMKKVKAYLEENYGIKNYIIVNSHSHWDHVWGNYEFRDSKIIAHEKCREVMNDTGAEDLNLLKSEFAKYEFEITLPNLTFKSEMKFENDEIVFFYSPGHSIDSSSLYDKSERILFVGDNIDNPIPSFMCWNNLSQYRETLQYYKSLDIDYVVQSHGAVMCPEVIQSNIDYLDRLIENRDISFDEVDVQRKHKGNLEFLRGYIND